MELLDRYLQAVKKYLPSRRQDDIIAELRANMESQLEDKEAGLGRPLTTGETEDWLKQMGAPMMVAARYRPQQYLIGPALYPIYLYVLRVTMMLAIMAYAIVSAIVIVVTAPGGASVVAAVARTPGILITVAAWVTLTFAAIEFFSARFPEKFPPLADLSGPWSPSSLPPLENDGDTVGKPRSYAHAVAEVVFGFILLVWLLLVPHHPFLLLGPGAAYLNASPFELAHVWWTFFLWCVALSALQLVWRCINLLRGIWQHRSRTEDLAIKSLGLIPIGVVLLVKDSGYVLLKNPAVDRAHYGTALESINKSIHLGFVVVCVVVLLQLAWEIGRPMYRGYLERAATR